MKPERIQRKRTAGFRLPPNTVCVTRPGPWGNPFYVTRYRGSKWEVFSALDITEDGDDTLIDCDDTREGAARKAVGYFEQALIGGELPYWPSDVREKLNGKHLACFCAPGAPCHADVLLRIANEEDP